MAKFKLQQTSKIYIAGHNGLVGSSLMKVFQANGHKNIFRIPSSELDLRNQQATKEYIQKIRPDLMIIAAAYVGGIHANNTERYEFISNNLMIQSNLINAAVASSVSQIVFLGSSCVYPRNSKQPIKEEYLLTGSLEATNQPYAIAKIAGIEMLNAINSQYGTHHFTVMPCNLFGEKDDFLTDRSHVLPAMLRKFHYAKIHGQDRVELWGSGNPFREFLHSDDLASGIYFAINEYHEGGIINIGAGKDITISELAEKISNIVGYRGKIIWDSTKPDGTYRKLLDVSKINNLGWKCENSLSNQIRSVYEHLIKTNGFDI